MADDWFKLNMDIFGNRKIKYLRRLPDGDSIALFWIALLSEARRCNADGKIFLTESIPYTPDMLAEEFKFEERIVVSALEAFSMLDMIHTDDGFLSISGWEDHQNAEGLAKIREQTRKRVAKHREKKSALQCNATVTQCNAIERDKEEEIEEEIESDISIKKDSVTCQQIVDLYHSICKSFSSVRSLSESRKKAIKARLNTYSLEDFRTVFENAEASSFLKGQNDRNWTATFDWLIKDANMAKVLEGNYADKPKLYGRKKPVPMGASGELGEAELEAIQRVLKKKETETVDSNPELAAEAEQLAQKMQEKYGKKDVS